MGEEESEFGLPEIKKEEDLKLEGEEKLIATEREQQKELPEPPKVAVFKSLFIGFFLGVIISVSAILVIDYKHPEKQLVSNMLQQTEDIGDSAPLRPDGTPEDYISQLKIKVKRAANDFSRWVDNLFDDLID